MARPGEDARAADDGAPTPAGRAGGGGRARSADTRTGGFAFREDVEGLRGLATLLVLLYHADVPYLSGGYVGLDVFFVISGFLITALLLREIETTGRLSLRAFYARRIRRLLPSVVVVLTFVMAAGAVVLSPLARESLAADALAANLYVVNWRFASQGVDYMAAELQASPVQHFWSLSVEEQFYLVWPVLIIALAWGWVRAGRGPRPGVAIAAALIGGLLLAHSIRYSGEAAGAAYFSTLTRGWEFAVGAAVALLPATRLRAPRGVVPLLVWGGLAALAWSALAYDDDTVFPGAAALVPALGAAAVIGAGVANPRSLPGRLVALSPARWVGRVSYSWYLWHWPLLVLADVAWGPLSVPQKLGVVAGSLAPSLLAHRLVEEPFRRSPRLARSPALTYRLGLACTASVGLVAVASWAAAPGVPLASAKDAPGARALRAGAEPQARAAAIRPTPASAIRDRGRADADGCLVEQRASRSGPCVYGDRSSATTVVLFGDSHAMQYFTPLDRIAARRGWRLVVLTKAGCTPARTPVYNRQLRRRYTECERWRERALRRIARERPALVVTANLETHVAWGDGRRLRARESARALEAGYVATLRRLRASGAPVAVMGGNPRPPRDVRHCVSRSLDRLRDCAFSRRDAYRHVRVNARAARRVAGARLIDPAPVLCPGRLCPAVIGNVLVYRNTAHITATYAGTLAPWLERRLPRPARR